MFKTTNVLNIDIIFANVFNLSNQSIIRNSHTEFQHPNKLESSSEVNKCCFKDNSYAFSTT